MGDLPDDTGFAAAMARLRWVQARLEEQADPRRVAVLDRARAGLEDELRNRARRTAASGRGAGRLDLDRLLGSLDEHAMVMYGAIRGELHAVVAHRGRVRHRPLGSVADVRGRLIRMRAVLRRLTAAPARGAGGAATMASAIDDGRGLEALLLQPLRLAGSAPLVVVPPPALLAVPWSLLDGLRARPVAVAPSATTWLDCSGRTVGRRALLANGPRLAHGALETRLLGTVYTAATRLTARAATVTRIRAEIGRCDVAHIVAHGRLHADNPQFCRWSWPTGR